MHKIREDIKGGGKPRLIPPLLSSDKVIDSKIIDDKRERYVVRDKNMQVDFLVINEIMNNGDELSIRFTKPILVLNEIAQKMSELNFEETVEVKHQDEFGQLGNSINKLANRIELTINELNDKNHILEEEIKIKQEIDETRKEFIFFSAEELYASRHAVPLVFGDFFNKLNIQNSI